METAAFSQKILRILSSEKPILRAYQALNKTPVRHAVKACVSALHPSLKRRRAAVAETHCGRKLDSFEKTCVRQLRENGYARLDGQLDPQLLERLLTYSADKLKRLEALARDQAVQTKSFWVRLSDEELTGKTLTPQNILVEFALQERLLRIASEYLGEAAFLQYILLTQSLPSDKPLTASQLWHQDRDDVKMLKVFVYLTDVTELACGPFTFYDAETSRSVRNSFFMRHLPDQEIYSQLPSKPIQMTGPKLSAFVVDTSRCYHMGSRLESGHSRLMYTGLYIGLPAIFPWNGKNQIVADANDPALTELQSFALKAEGPGERRAT